MNQTPETNRGNEYAYAGALFTLIARSFAATVEVFLHRSDSFGERYAGMQVAVGLLLIFLFPVFWEGHSPAGILLFLPAYLIMLCNVRLRSWIRLRRGGSRPHSTYSGAPYLMRFTRMDEERLKCSVEPMLVMLTGVLVTAIDPPLGSYLIVAGLALGASNGMALQGERRRAIELNDSYLEQRGVVERFRGMRPD